MNSNGPEKSEFLSIMTKTWSRDSHGLYDYESTQVKSAQNVVNEANQFLLRKKLDIKLVNLFEEIKDEELLLEVKYEKPNESFFLNHSVPLRVEPSEKNINELQNKIWFVIKNDEGNGTNTNQQNIVNKNEDYFLCLNDIIKLGRVKYALNEMNVKKSQDAMEVDPETDMSQSPYNISKINMGTEPIFDFIYKTYTPPLEYIEEISCKYCLAGGNDEENPLVEMCKCTGGIKYSHYLCLKMWMQTKLSRKENEKQTVTSYNIKAFNCEICKTPYPFRFIVNGVVGKIYDMIDIIRPNKKNYIILESLNQLKDNNNLKSIHVIVLEDQKITLGRGHESDVRINDISVSRTHAVLIFNQVTGKLCLRDLKSKFGTLALLKREIKVKEKKLSLQIGRTYLEVLTSSQREQRKNKEKKVTSNLGSLNPYNGNQSNSPSPLNYMSHSNNLNLNYFDMENDLMNDGNKGSLSKFLEDPNK